MTADDAAELTAFSRPGKLETKERRGNAWGQRSTPGKR
jgi:hypothetical protein